MYGRKLSAENIMHILKSSIRQRKLSIHSTSTTIFACVGCEGRRKNLNWFLPPSNLSCYYTVSQKNVLLYLAKALQSRTLFWDTLGTHEARWGRFCSCLCCRLCDRPRSLRWWSEASGCRSTENRDWVSLSSQGATRNRGKILTFSLWLWFICFYFY